MKLSELGTTDVWTAVLAFHLGVEVAQLATVALLLPLAYLGRSTWACRWFGVRGGSVAILGSFERMGGV